MIEFRELRSGQDMAYFMRMVVSFKEYGGQDSSHLSNRSVIDNSFVTVYDYDLKACAAGLVGLLVLMVCNLWKR